MNARLLGVGEVAGLLGIGVRTVWRMRDAGRMPGAVSIGKCVRWRLADLEAWVNAGCPDVKRMNWTPPAATECACSKGGAR